MQEKMKDQLIGPYTLDEGVCHGSGSSRADRFATRLLTRSAGVHVDFHAHLHFDNLRSLPSHPGSSQVRSARCLRLLKGKTAPTLTQVSVVTFATRCHVAHREAPPRPRNVV